MTPTDRTHIVDLATAEMAAIHRYMDLLEIPRKHNGENLSASQRVARAMPGLMVARGWPSPPQLKSRAP